MKKTQSSSSFTRNIGEEVIPIWTEFEKTKKMSRLKREEIHNKYIRKFSNAILVKLKSSIFGCFLDIFNIQQRQDDVLNNLKLAITEYEMNSYGKKDFDRFDKLNNFIENSFQYLKRIINEEKPVSYAYLKNDIKCLKLNDFYVRQSVITYINK